MEPGGFPERIWRERWSRAAALGVVLMALSTQVRMGPRPALGGPGDAPLHYEPVQLDGGDPARRDVGRLHFLGGWTLDSPDPRFGGLSGLHVENGRAIAISDAGMVVRFPLPGTVAAPRIGFQPVISGPGTRRLRTTRDTEALAVSGNELWLSFERYNAVWRYDRTTLAAQGGARPEPMRRWWGNSGPESLVRLADGRFLVIEEGRDNGSTESQAILFAGDPSVAGTAAIRLTYRRPAGYRATDAALLPDGRVLILNRSLSWLRLSAKLVVADPRGLGEGGVLAGLEVATLAAPMVIENMEGMAVTQEAGRTIVWLTSDDDFMRMVRHTYLLKFELRL